MSLQAIIIDDAPAAIQSLKADLEDYCPDVQVTGTADSVMSGAKLLRKQKPDMLFLDIQLGDGDGFDLLQIIDTSGIKVIFTTSSDAHAIRAFRFSAIDYLLKPINPEELVNAVEKASRQVDDQTNLDVLESNLKSSRPPEKLVLHTQEKLRVAKVEEIVRCAADGNYTVFHFTDGKSMIIARTLKDYDELLQEAGFMRVHQSHLVNLRHVKEFIKADGGYLVMGDEFRVPVSYRKRQQVLDAIHGI